MEAEINENPLKKLLNDFLAWFYISLFFCGVLFLYNQFADEPLMPRPIVIAIEEALMAPHANVECYMHVPASE